LYKCNTLNSGIILNSAVTLGVLDEESLTHASIEAPGQPFCRWMTKSALLVWRLI